MKRNTQTKKITKSPSLSKNKYTPSAIVTHFLQLLHLIKLYHWKTYSFSQHRATDELYSSLNEHIDKFVEVLLGKAESRIQHMKTTIPLLFTSNKTDFKNQIYLYREYLIIMSQAFSTSEDSDILNIRDEILGDVNQFLYLLTFDR